MCESVTPPACSAGHLDRTTRHSHAPARGGVGGIHKTDFLYTLDSDVEKNINSTGSDVVMVHNNRRFASDGRDAAHSEPAWAKTVDGPIKILLACPHNVRADQAG